MLKNLNKVAIQMSKSTGRVSYRSHIPRKDENTNKDSIDPQRAFFAKRDYASGGKRQITLSIMSSTLPRDEKMYDCTDFRQNIHLDNTKQERQSMIDRKNEDRMIRVRLHT